MNTKLKELKTKVDKQDSQWDPKKVLTLDKEVIQSFVNIHGDRTCNSINSNCDKGGAKL